MGIRSGRKTSRTIVEKYRGFFIVKVTTIEYHRSIFDSSLFDRNWVDKKYTHFTFCKDGDEKCPSKDYQIYVDGIEACKGEIDNFLNGKNRDNGDIYHTLEEWRKYVTKPNEKCNWAYGYNSLMKLMRQHRKADKRMKWFIEERLHDANFHSAASILSDGDYDTFEKFVADDNPFRERFEVCTHTKRKPIKNPRELEGIIKSAIEETLLNYGIKETSVEVKYC